MKDSNGLGMPKKKKHFCKIRMVEFFPCPWVKEPFFVQFNKCPKGSASVAARVVSQGLGYTVPRYVLGGYRLHREASVN